MVRAMQVMPMLSVADMERTLVFYRDRLGGEPSYQFPPAGHPQFIVLKFGDSEVGFGVLADSPLHGQPQRPARGHRIELCVYVDDVDATAEVLAADGAGMLAAPMDQPWGERCAFVTDPDGNIVMLTATVSA